MKASVDVRSTNAQDHLVAVLVSRDGAVTAWVAGRRVDTLDGPYLKAAEAAVRSLAGAS